MPGEVEKILPVILQEGYDDLLGRTFGAHLGIPHARGSVAKCDVKFFLFLVIYMEKSCIQVM